MKVQREEAFVRSADSDADRELGGAERDFGIFCVITWERGRLPADALIDLKRKYKALNRYVFCDEP